MKINTLLLLLLIGIVGYALWTRNGLTLPNLSAPATPRKAASTPIASAPVRSTPTRTMWKRTELVVIHGRIIKESPNCVVVVCEPFDDGGTSHMRDQSYARWEWHKEPNAAMSAGDQKALVSEAIATDLKHYGPLMLLEGGSWGKAASGGAPSAQGTVSVLGPLPRAAGARPNAINVIGAPLGDPTSRLPQTDFTTQFQVEPEKPGSWLGRPTGNPLDARPR